MSDMIQYIMFGILGLVIVIVVVFYFGWIFPYDFSVKLFVGNFTNASKFMYGALNMENGQVETSQTTIIFKDKVKTPKDKGIVLVSHGLKFNVCIYDIHVDEDIKGPVNDNYIKSKYVHFDEPVYDFYIPKNTYFNIAIYDSHVDLKQSKTNLEHAFALKLLVIPEEEDLREYYLKDI